MKGLEEYYVIKRLVDEGGNKKRARVRLRCSMRTINRFIKGYEREGKSYFIHGNCLATPFARTRDDRSYALAKELLYYTDTGKIKTIASYSNDIIVGTIKHYDENGVLINEVTP
jgi:hypothetical protein